MALRYRSKVAVLVATVLMSTLSLAVPAPAAAHQASGSNWRNFHQLCTSSSSCVTSGNMVRFWQVVLFSSYREPQGLRCWFVDGAFGPNTENWTERWQSGYGLAADGWVGPNTWSELRSRLQVRSVTSYAVTYGWQPNPAYGSPTVMVEYNISTGKWRYRDLCDGGYWNPSWKPLNH